MSTANIIRFDEKREYFEQGLKQVYGDEAKTLAYQYKDWLKEETAERWFESEMGHSGLGVMPEKTIGQAVTTDRIYHGVVRNYVMKAYALGLVIQYEVIRWDLFKVFKPITQDLAKTAGTRYDLVAFGIPNNAFSTANSAYTDYRGEALCSVSHSRLDGGTWKNRPTTDIGLSMTALQQGIEDLTLTVNERGIYETGDEVSPTLLMTTPQNNWLAHTLLRSDYNPDNANMAVNNAARYNLQIKTYNYITTSTYWFLWCNPKKVKMKMAKGDDPDLMKDSEFSTMNSVFRSYCSFRVEVFDGRRMYGSTGV